MSSQTLLRVYVGVVTLSRFLFAGLALVAAAYQQWTVILVLTLAAVVTDWADGWLARKWNVVSVFGKFFDPLSDKVFCLTVLWLGALHEANYVLIAFAIVLSIYDASTTALRLFIRRGQGVMVGASSIAKLKTAALMLGLITMVAGILLGPHLLGSVIDSITLVPLGSASVLSVISLWQYIRRNLAGAASPMEQIVALGDIDFAQWHKDFGIECLLCDIEGTLSPWRESNVPPETIQALQRARRAGIRKLGLVSNISPRKEAQVRQIVDTIGADVYYMPHVFRQRKPSAYMLRAAMHELGVTPAQTALVGDKLIDVIAGRRAHVRRVAWVERVGSVDQTFDRLIYRRAEPFIKWLAKG